ncbi:hypothetical protein GNX71_09545 [Variovorax sp. RKNM96]|uniref:hypothetical protein n=1 Tax=Variovorax sp. RKNM96 TaxID=2681552 RepID=UPI001980FE9E|nr:hypothetical protein [Variovorax sp. RKNM96]QSI29809.1 hypothetical protein GNX71_09545 [Variovorax sp. RKNM96]
MIDPSNQLAALIRAQFAAQLKAQGRHRSPAGQEADSHPARTAHTEEKGFAPAGDQPRADAGDGEAQIRQLVALRVRALSPNDPQRQRKAFRLFLESVLMQELGRDRLDNKGFDQMVDAVLQRMESDAGLSAALHEAGELLLSEAAPPPASARQT